MSELNTEFVRRHFSKGAVAYYENGDPVRMMTPEEEAQAAARFDEWKRKNDTSFAAIGWDAAVAALKYEDGTPVEVTSMTNPYREAGDQKNYWMPEPQVAPTGYRVWRGFQRSDGASFQSSEIHSRLSSAIESARRWERKGYDTQITEEKYDVY